MIRFLLHIVFLFSIILTSVAQETITITQAQEMLNDVAKNYDKETLYYKIKLTSYKGHQSSTKEDESLGYFIKKGNSIINYQMGIYSVQDKKIKVMIDSNERIVGISYPDTASYLSYSNTNLVEQQKDIESIRFSERHNRNYLTILYKEGNSFDKIIIILSASNELKTVELYYSQSISYENKNGELNSEKAKIRIDYFPMKSIPELPLEINDIVLKKNKEYKVTSAFSKYELIDFRYEK